MPRSVGAASPASAATRSALTSATIVAGPSPWAYEIDWFLSQCAFGKPPKRVRKDQDRRAGCRPAGSPAHASLAPIIICVDATADAQRRPCKPVSGWCLRHRRGDRIGTQLFSLAVDNRDRRAPGRARIRPSGAPTAGFNRGQLRTERLINSFRVHPDLSGTRSDRCLLHVGYSPVGSINQRSDIAVKKPRCANMRPAFNEFSDTAVRRGMLRAEKPVRSIFCWNTDVIAADRGPCR